MKGLEHLCVTENNCKPSELIDAKNKFSIFMQRIFYANHWALHVLEENHVINLMLIESSTYLTFQHETFNCSSNFLQIY